MHFFEYRNNELYAEEVPLREIAQKVGSPTYVYSKATFTRHIKVMQAAFNTYPTQLCYSVKVAGNLHLLRLAAQCGAGADIVSGGELYRALKAGIDPRKIVFSGVGKKAYEMAEALTAGIMMFNVESEEELHLLNKVAGEKGQIAPFSLRLNPDVDPQTHPYVATGLKSSKFGLPYKKAMDIYVKSLELANLKAIGVDCHIGSQIITEAPFIEAAHKLVEVAVELKNHGINLEYVDMGGGLGTTYFDENPPPPSVYAQGLINAVKDHGLKLVIEPGRVIAANSAVLLAEVLYNKPTGEKHFVITDAAMNDLIRPSLYGSFHAVEPVKWYPERPVLEVDVVGPVCESSDFLAKGRLMQQVKAGELLAVRSAGAYGFVMSSNYNARPRTAEVLVDGADYTVIRPRETYEDLIRPEIL